MAGLSTAMQQNILLFLTARTPLPTQPSTVYISLHTADPGQTGASEVTTGAGSGWVGYARQAVSCGSANGTAGANLGTEGTAGTGSAFNAPATDGSTGQKATNVNTITFPNSGGTSGTVTVTYFGVWDAVSSGNFLIGGALTASQVIGANANGPTFSAAALTLDMK